MVEQHNSDVYWLIVDDGAAEQHSSERFMAGGCRWWTAQFRKFNGC